MKTFLTIGCILGVATAGWLASAKSRVRAPEPSNSWVESPKVEGVGFIEPASQILGLSFQMAGVIAECHVEVGQAVEKGTPLMTLANASELAELNVVEAGLQVVQADRARLVRGVHEQQIDAAERAVDASKARLEFLELERARAENLLSERQVSRSLYDQAKSEALQGQADLARAQAELLYLEQYVLDEDVRLADQKVALAGARVTQARARLNETILRAPRSGTVLEILRRPGEIVDLTMQSPVVQFADLSQQRVRAEIDERYVQSLRAGQKVTIYGRNLNGATYQGRIVLVKQVMGKKTVFTRVASERKSLDVLEVLIEIEGEFVAPAGLRVDVRIEIDDVNST